MEAVKEMKSGRALHRRDVETDGAIYEQSEETDEIQPSRNDSVLPMLATTVGGAAIGAVILPIAGGWIGGMLGGIFGGYVGFQLGRK